MSKAKRSKSKEPPVAEGPVRVELFPPYFVAEMKRRYSESDHTTPLDLDQFLDQLAAGAERDSNHQQLWLHRTCSAWRRALLLAEEFGEEPAQHEYVALLWLWQLSEFVRSADFGGGGDAEQVTVKLADFEQDVERQMERYVRDFEQIGWMCLVVEIAVPQNTRMSGISTGSQTSKGRKKRMSSMAASNSTLATFRAQLAVLTGLLHTTFAFDFQFEMFVRLVRPTAERFWVDVQSEQYHMNKPRAYAPKKKGEKGGSEKGGTSPETSPQTSPQGTPRTDVSATSPRPDTPGSVPPADADEQMPFILPLNMAEDIGDEFWEELFKPEE